MMENVLREIAGVAEVQRALTQHTMAMHEVTAAVQQVREGIREIVELGDVARRAARETLRLVGGQSA